MAYYLTIKKNKEYNKLDISSLPEFKKISKFREKTSYSLEEIDYFTSCFSNEIVLKRALLQEGIIEECDVTKDIEIRYKDKDKLSKVRYDLVYKDAAKYFNVDLMDAEGPDMILDIPEGKVIQKNYVGKDMKNYDGMIVLSHFKGHPMGGYGAL